MLFDPLAIRDPVEQGDWDLAEDAMRRLLQTSLVVKVFHGAAQDVMVLNRYFKINTAPILDTVPAAFLCGWGTSPSYSLLVKICYGVELDKTNQTSDWRKRPLTDDQLSYAKLDVVYLSGIARRLKAEVEQRHRTAWLQQEMNVPLLDQHRLIVETALRGIKGSRNQQRFARLKEWVAFREQWATHSDRPRTWIISDKTLQKLAGKPVTELDSEETLITPKMRRNRNWKGLIRGLTAIDRSGRTPYTARQAEGIEQCWDALRLQREELSERMNISAGFLLPNHIMRGWLLGNLNVDEWLTPWRATTFAPILSLVAEMRDAQKHEPAEDKEPPTDDEMTNDVELSTDAALTNTKDSEPMAEEVPSQE